MLLQYVLLGLFGLCAVVSFVLRVRMASLEGALQRGEKDDDETRAAAARYYRLAVIFAIASAAFLLLCGAIGAADAR
ncbi:MAG: hypothetical protein AB7C89_00095 [Intestinibacillus sp.]